MNHQADMRARLFRERSPAAYGILTDPNPPILTKVPEVISAEEVIRIASQTLTIGEQRFKEADTLLRDGKTREARDAFEALRAEFPHSWIDRVSRERLAKLGE
jgi:hypothetical protein